MGVFGIQLVTTAIVASFLHKLTPHYSIGKWLSTAGLTRYRPPSDSSLRSHIPLGAPANRNKKKAGNSREHSSLDGTLTVPKSASFKLEAIPVKPADLTLVHYTSEFQWMVDFTLGALMVFLTTSVYYYIKPSAATFEYNLSTIWMLAVFGYVLVSLGSLTLVYLSDELERERSICTVFTMLFFVFALGILLIDERLLEFCLERSHQNITESLTLLLETLLEEETKFSLFPLWALKISLAVVGSLLSANLVFPGFRYAEMHFDSLRYSKSPLLKTVLHVNYFSPVVCMALWIRPLSKDVIAEADTVEILTMKVSYESFRFATLLLVCMLRMILYRVHLQNYLNLAKLRIGELRMEHGRITVSELQLRVSSIFSFYGGVAVQYVAPTLLVFSLSVLLHLSSDYHSQNGDAAISDASSENPFRLSGIGISMFHGCISFMCWWVCFTNFMTSGFGYVIRAYL